MAKEPTTGVESLIGAEIKAYVGGEQFEADVMAVVRKNLPALLREIGVIPPEPDPEADEADVREHLVEGGLTPSGADRYELDKGRWMVVSKGPLKVTVWAGGSLYTTIPVPAGNPGAAKREISALVSEWRAEPAD